MSARSHSRVTDGISKTTNHPIPSAPAAAQYFSIGSDFITVRQATTSNKVYPQNYTGYDNQIDYFQPFARRVHAAGYVLLVDNRLDRCFGKKRIRS
jgi:hypothetical protein